MVDAAQREECRYQLTLPLLEDAGALEAALHSIDDPGSHDLLLLRLSIAAPRRASRLCQQVRTDAAAEKCRQVLGRPHLSTTPRAPRSPAEPDQ